MSQFQKDLIILVAATLGVIAVIVAATSLGKSDKPEHSDYTEPASEEMAITSETEDYDVPDTDCQPTAEAVPESDTETASEPGIIDYSEWVCNTRLSDADISGMPKSELRILRNTIYARHGHIFKSADLREHFSKFDWYVPSVSVVTDLSDIEQHNVALIQRYE